MPPTPISPITQFEEDWQDPRAEDECTREMYGILRNRQPEGVPYEYALDKNTKIYNKGYDISGVKTRRNNDKSRTKKRDNGKSKFQENLASHRQSFPPRFHTTYAKREIESVYCPFCNSQHFPRETCMHPEMYGVADKPYSPRVKLCKYCEKWHRIQFLCNERVKYEQQQVEALESRKAVNRNYSGNYLQVRKLTTTIIEN